MAVFKKSYLQGNPMLNNGTALEFKDGYYETAKEAEIAMLREMGYAEVAAADKPAPKQAAPVEKKAAIISSNAVLK
jgi:hypothetical protein